MDAVKKSKDLHIFLESIVGGQTSERVFLDDYEALIIPPGRSTPFLDLVGLSSTSTVIFSRKRLSRKNMLREEIGLTTLDGLDITELEKRDLSINGTVDSSSENGELSTLNGSSFSSPWQVVSIGRLLTNKRLCLSGSTHLHEFKSYSFDSHKTKDDLLPLSLSSSRFLLSLFCLGSWSSKKLLPDVWTVCERNSQKIVALGCQFDATSSMMRMVTIKEDESQLLEHQGSRKYCSAYGEYEITTAEPTDGEESFLEKIVLQFAWNDSDIGILAPPPENSDAVLNVCNVPGHLFSPVLSMFEEVKSLYYLCQIAAGKAKWVACEDEDVLVSINKRTQLVKGFIDDMAHPLASSADVTVISPACSHTIYEHRSNLDFVEHLWMFCRTATSYEELKVIFAEVFKAVVLGHLQPFIHRKSSSTLAGLLRQVLVNRDREVIQDLAVKLQLLLTEARLVPCLIQVGLEKLKRDYSAFFAGAELLSLDYFEHFFTPKVNLSYLDQCVQLCKLHNVAELGVSLMKTLNLPTPVLSSFTKAVMEVYKKDASYQPFSKSPIFSLSLPAYSQALKSVVALCSKLSPDTWSLTVQETSFSCSDVSVPRKMYVKIVRPLLNFLQKPDITDQYYTYTASCELVPLVL